MKVAFCALIIFTIASYFRLFHLDLIEFKYDEAYTVFEMTQFYQNPYLMQVGPPQSTGVYNFPLFNYLMIFLSLFSHNPMYLSFLIGLINSFFIVVFYLLFRKRFGNLPTFLVSIFLALSPWSIIFSRKIWIPDLMFPFALFATYYLCKIILDQERKAILPLTIFVTLLAQIHASGVFFAIITGGILLVSKTKINYSYFTKGLLIGLIPAIPYFIRQLTSTPFCIDCVAFFKYQNETRSFDFTNFLRPWDFYNGLSFPIILGESYPDFLNLFPIVKYINWLFYIEYLFLLIGLLLAIKSQKKYLMLLIYPIVLPLLYVFLKTPGIVHYFVVLMPLMIVFLLLAFKSSLDYFKKSWYQYCILAVISCFLLANLIFDYSFQQFIQNTKTIKGDYGPVYDLTYKYVNSQLKNYTFLPYYEELQSYAFMFAQSPYLHEQLGRYLLNKNQVQLAISEYNQALILDPKNYRARANIVYIYSAIGNKEAAIKEMDILYLQDATLAAQLEKLIKQKK